MLLIRQGGPQDFKGVFALAKVLDSYNLPADRGHIRSLLELSEASFSGKVRRSRAHYLFVLEKKNRNLRKIIGCSLIIAKHGVPGHPHLWLALNSVTKRSRTLGIRKTHKVMRLGYTEDGPTEVGGLVVLPAYRKLPEQCGLQLSHVRFLYMAMHPDRFERDVLVEYRGAMGRGNKSPFWERIGRVFTGLPYQKADRLSVTNKEFIYSLLPRDPIYCALLPRSVQAAIGAVHPDAQRAAALLRSIGFKALPQIEPFDGGPYYSAVRRDIRLIRQAKTVPVRFLKRAAGGTILAAVEKEGIFRAVLAKGVLSSGRLDIEKKGLELLNVGVGEKVHVCRVSR